MMDVIQTGWMGWIWGIRIFAAGRGRLALH